MRPPRRFILSAAALSLAALAASLVVSTPAAASSACSSGGLQICAAHYRCSQDRCYLTHYTYWDGAGGVHEAY